MPYCSSLRQCRCSWNMSCVTTQTVLYCAVLWCAVQGEHWSRHEPFRFGPAVQPVLMTTLLCAKRRGLRLPLELWEHVFSQLQRRDFATAVSIA
eukprot:m.232680 g.232680  ORF g.232680 m.232680 type:complete len:94 (+) comp10875_c0_seq91:107-388(+)